MTKLTFLKKSAAALASVYFVILISDGCKDKGTDLPQQSPVIRDDSARFNRDVHPILLANCALSGCHSGSSPTGGFNQETYAGVRAGGNTFGSNVIQPGDSSSNISALNVGSGIMKMLRNVNNPYGNFRMPQGSGPYVTSGLPDTMIVLIGKWIMQGAKNN